jgi:hypothetical protein
MNRKKRIADSIRRKCVPVRFAITAVLLTSLLVGAVNARASDEVPVADDHDPVTLGDWLKQRLYAYSNERSEASAVDRGIRSSKNAS